MIGILFLSLRILAGFALFLFLAWALRLLWLDLKSETNPITARVPELALLPLGLPDCENFIPATPDVIIGRDPACDMHLNDHTISGQHARLVYRQNQWWVEDLQSTNGTFLNQLKITHPVVLTNGDELRFGQVTFNISIHVGM